MTDHKSCKSFMHTIDDHQSEVTFQDRDNNKMYKLRINKNKEESYERDAYE